MTALVTNDGLANNIAAWGAYASRPLYLQVGSGTGQDATATDVAAPVGDRELGSTSTETTNIVGDTFKVTGTVMAAEDTTVTEVGVFDVDGNLGIYGDFAAIDLAAGDAIVFAISVTVS